MLNYSSKREFTTIMVNKCLHKHAEENNCYNGKNFQNTLNISKASVEQQTLFSTWDIY